jgi:hypothetical protein
VRRFCQGHRYHGAVLSSNPAGGGNFQFTYGYIEFRAILPAADRAWSSLWVNGQTWPDDGEIDVLESGLPSATAQKWHYHDSTVGVAGGRVEVPGASTDWHTYAADWEPGRVTWYYDGDLVTTIATGEIGVPHYLMMNVSDWKQSNPSGPATTRIDYVRVWQRYPDPVARDSASARVVDRTLVVAGGKGAADNLRISPASGSSLRVTDLPGRSYGGSKIEAGAGCTQTGRYAADCHGEIAQVRVLARDRADKVINSTGVGSTLLGGGAKDTLIGGSEEDVLIGGPGADAMEGRNGDDVLRARDMAPDRAIDCGAGTDRAALDKRTKDPGSAVKGCETKTRR